MHLWVAMKYSPLALGRDKTTHLNFGRLDGRWYLPSWFDHKYPIHVELVITYACTGPARMNPCTLCKKLPAAVARCQYKNKHYLTYSVNELEGKVYRSTKRNILPPKVNAANDEHWSYWRLSVDAAQVLGAFMFLERQLGKPLRPRFNLNFWLLCRRSGVKLEDDFEEATHWYCSELAAAVLILYCPEFKGLDTRDPCLVSPCVLDSLLRDLVATEGCAYDVPKIPEPISVFTIDG